MFGVATVGVSAGWRRVLAYSLNAYRDRLQQAYVQLQASYQTLQQRDAAYQQALQQTEAAAANL